MTDGEKAVWAAAFSRIYRDHIAGGIPKAYKDRFKGVLRGPKLIDAAREAHERSAGLDAAERATYTVIAMRKAAVLCGSHHGERSDTTAMLRSMVSDPPTYIVGSLTAHCPWCYGDTPSTIAEPLGHMGNVRITCRCEREYQLTARIGHEKIYTSKRV